MAKKDLGSALGESLQAERATVNERIAKVETLLTGGQQIPEPVTEPEPKQNKVVRDGFSMPSNDYALIAELQDKMLELKMSATKSEVVRAGLHALNQLNAEDLQHIFTMLEKVKTGRPSQI